MILYAHVYEEGAGADYAYWSELDEMYCDSCCGTGVAGERQRRETEEFLRDNGFSSVEEYRRHEEAQRQEDLRVARENARRREREACGKCGGSGQIPVSTRGGGYVPTWYMCRRCKGTGKEARYRYP